MRERVKVGGERKAPSLSSLMKAATDSYGYGLLQVYEHYSKLGHSIALALLFLIGSDRSLRVHSREWQNCVEKGIGKFKEKGK